MRDGQHCYCSAVGPKWTMSGLDLGGHRGLNTSSMKGCAAHLVLRNVQVPSGHSPRHPLASLFVRSVWQTSPPCPLGRTLLPTRLTRDIRYICGKQVTGAEDGMLFVVVEEKSIPSCISNTKNKAGSTLIYNNYLFLIKKVNVSYRFNNVLVQTM